MRVRLILSAADFSRATVYPGRKGLWLMCMVLVWLGGRGMDAQRIGPSRRWYWVAAFLVVGSVAWIAVNLVVGLGSAGRQIDAFQRVPLPGQGEVTFSHPGGYIVFYEGPGASDGNVPALTVSLVPVGGGDEVPLAESGSTTTYALAGHSGSSVGTFQIERPGRYLLRAEGDVQGMQADVAVGHDITGAIVRTVLLVLLGGAVLFVSGTALAIAVAVRRARARRRRWPPIPAGRDSARLSGPAGWFTDPSMRHQLRYWNGQRWTDHVLDSGMPGIDRLPQPTAADGPPR